MDCSVVQDKLSLYVDGVLDEGTLEAIENHLASCEDCRIEYEELRILVKLTGEIAEIEPPAALNAAIKASAREALVPECAQILQVLSEYVDGELPESKASSVKRHLAICESCAQEMEMLTRTITVVAAIEEIEPPSGLREKIAAATTSSDGHSRVSRVLERMVEGLWPRTVGWAAATAAVAAVIVGMAINQKPETTPAIVAVRPVPQVTREVPTRNVEPKTAKTAREKTNPDYSRTAILAPEYALRESITGPGETSHPMYQEKPVSNEKPAVAKRNPDKMPQKLVQNPDLSLVKATVRNSSSSDIKVSELDNAQTPEETTDKVVALASTSKEPVDDASPSLMKIAVAPPNPGRDMNDWAQSIKQELDAKRKPQNSSTLRLLDKRF